MTVEPYHSMLGEPDTWTWPDAYNLEEPQSMEIPYTRVFTNTVNKHEDIEAAKLGLIKRAEKMDLSLSDGVFAVNYHPTTKLFVVALTITPYGVPPMNEEDMKQLKGEILQALPFRPSGHWIVVERDADKDMIGSVALAQRYALKMSRGTVLGVGWGIISPQTGELIRTNPNIKVGDVVQWEANEGQKKVDHDIEVQGKTYTFVAAGNIVLVENPVQASQDSAVVPLDGN